MDFFFNIFTTAPAEIRTELDVEIMQVPVDYDGVNGGGGCIVA